MSVLPAAMVTNPRAEAKAAAVVLIRETHDILTRGLEIEGQKERLVGLDAAYRHFVEGGRALLDKTGRVKEDHDIRAEAPEVAQEYLDAEAHPERRFGAFSGLLEMDEGCGGTRPGELWVHGAYPGEMKSSFSMNYGYNALTRYRRNVVYVSLEMPDDQVRRGIEVRANGYVPQRFAVPAVCTRREHGFGCLEVDVRATLAHVPD